MQEDLYSFLLGATSSKTCGSDGNWQTSDDTELEFTEYDGCSRKDQEQVLLIIFS